ncbi:DUF5362 family protein [Pontibacter anaerobius]|uniref:DUF5362 family protein n=1 Tax=Pontibacter anaerobius TaxID=2993940 RepID=A0ABT3RLE5_9BACT|nr:DUF5362 family protein [Pontibacter anaerobius]MCX2742198.1 DUF5362 family protein [Pontibacter anaerobius]
MDSGLYGSAPAPQHVSINPPSAGYLQEIAKWGKFLAIVGFVMIGFMVVAGLFAGAAMGSLFFPQESVGGAAGIIGGGFFAFFYLLFALLYFFPVLYLYRFSGKMQDALRLQNEELLTTSFANLKSLFKFVGILTIVMLSFYVLGLLFMFLGVGIGSMMQ